jgi:hypothetical protein
LLSLAKNKIRIFKEKGLDYGKGVGTQLKTAGVSYTL